VCSFIALQLGFCATTIATGGVTAPLVAGRELATAKELLLKTTE